MTFNTTSLPEARDLVASESEPKLWQRAAAAALTGLGGSICANGPDVVKAHKEIAMIANTMYIIYINELLYKNRY